MPETEQPGYENGEIELTEADLDRQIEALIIDDDEEDDDFDDFMDDNDFEDTSDTYHQLFNTNRRNMCPLCESAIRQGATNCTNSDCSNFSEEELDICLSLTKHNPGARQYRAHGIGYIGGL